MKTCFVDLACSLGQAYAAVSHFEAEAVTGEMLEDDPLVGYTSQVVENLAAANPPMHGSVAGGSTAHIGAEEEVVAEEGLEEADGLPCGNDLEDEEEEEALLETDEIVQPEPGGDEEEVEVEVEAEAVKDDGPRFGPETTPTYGGGPPPARVLRKHQKRGGKRGKGKGGKRDGKDKGRVQGGKGYGGHGGLGKRLWEPEAASSSSSRRRYDIGCSKASAVAKWQEPISN